MDNQQINPEKQVVPRYEIPDNPEDFDDEKAFDELMRLAQDLADIKAKYQ